MRILKAVFLCSLILTLTGGSIARAQGAPPTAPDNAGGAKLVVFEVLTRLG
jgi:hypothetical protein